MAINIVIAEEAIKKPFRG